MNKNQRKQLAAALNGLQEALDVVAAIKCEEEDKVSNLAENFGGSDVFEKIEEGLSELEEIESDLENAISVLSGMT